MVGMTHQANAGSRHPRAPTPTSTSLVPRSQPVTVGHNNNKPVHAYPPSSSSSSVPAHYQNSHLNGPKEAGHPLPRSNGVTTSAHNGVVPKPYANYLPTHDLTYPAGYKPYDYPPRSAPTGQPPPSHRPRHAVQESGAAALPPASERQTQGSRYPPPPPTHRPSLGPGPAPSPFYGKPNGPPAAAHRPGASGPPPDYRPPPAHGGSARHPAVHVPPPEPMSNHFGRASAVPVRLAPPAAPSAAPPEQPLDLGLPAKRRATLQEDAACPEEAASPKKLPRVDACAQLYKVSEPSVLPASEPSLITTVENAALAAARPPALAKKDPPGEDERPNKRDNNQEPEEQVFG